MQRAKRQRQSLLQGTSVALVLPRFERTIKQAAAKKKAPAGKVTAGLHENTSKRHHEELFWPSRASSDVQASFPLVGFTKRAGTVSSTAPDQSG